MANMDIKEIQEQLRRGVRPSPDYPDLPNDFTAEQLIAYDPKAELEYRMVKDRNPEMTRAMLMQQWRAFRIGRIWTKDKRGSDSGGGLASFLRNAAASRKKKRD